MIFHGITYGYECILLLVWFTNKLGMTSSLKKNKGANYRRTQMNVNKTNTKNLISNPNPTKTKGAKVSTIKRPNQGLGLLSCSLSLPCLASISKISYTPLLNLLKLRRGGGEVATACSWATSAVYDGRTKPFGGLPNKFTCRTQIGLACETLDTRTNLKEKN